MPFSRSGLKKEFSWLHNRRTTRFHKRSPRIIGLQNQNPFGTQNISGEQNGEMEVRDPRSKRNDHNRD